MFLKKHNNKGGECPFTAFFIDVVNSKKNLNTLNDVLIHHDFINKFTFKLKDKLLVNENNVLNFFNVKNYVVADKRNPIVIGDGTCYFFKTENMDKEEFDSILLQTMRKENYPFSLHVKSCYYETEDMSKAESKLYKGYVFRLLEDRKEDGYVLDKNSTLENYEEK